MIWQNYTFIVTPQNEIANFATKIIYKLSRNGQLLYNPSL